MNHSTGPIVTVVATFFLAGAVAAQQATSDRAAEARAIAATALDDKAGAADREAAIRKRLELAPDVVRAMAEGLGQDAKEEYRRIPWIWRAAIEMSRRNDAGEIRRLLDVALPRIGAPLRDWQAVVVGGGVINAIGQLGLYPRERVLAIVGDDTGLKARWERSIELAFAMADDAKVPHGTRYDALRMVAMAEPGRAVPALERYLPKGTNAELQMGAVSGLSDVASPEGAGILIAALPELTAGNRKLAIDGLLRDAARAKALREMIEARKVDRGALSSEQAKRLEEAAKK